MENMNENDWDTANAELSSTDEAKRVQANHFAKEVVELAADWLRHRDKVKGTGLMASVGDESPEFAKTALAIGTGIQIALWGIWMDDSEHLARRLEQIRLMARQDLRSA
jgi:hypothetical protein